MKKEIIDNLPTVGILGTNGSVLRSELGAKSAMKAVGENTGNLMFQYSMAKNIKNPKVFVDFSDISSNLENIKSIVDVLCIPAANQINPAWDLGWWADIIEMLDKPIVIAGLGGQAKINELQNAKLQKGTLRYLDILKERAIEIGVRGEDTLALLDKLGIHNAVVTGCPSNFINCSLKGSNIQKLIDDFKYKEYPKVNFLAGTLEEYTRDTEKALFELTTQHHGQIIYQTNVKILSFLLGEEEDEVSKYINWEANLIGPKFEVREYRRKIFHRGVFYFSAPGWIDKMSFSDLSIGMRIHGSVAAIQGGSLGVCVAFDSRTLELVKTMGYPYILSDDVKKINNLRELDQFIEFSALNFDVLREKLRAKLKLTIEQHGVVSKF